MLLNINPRNPERRKIRQVAEILRQGGVIGYPTDTVYGIGCSIFQKAGINRIYEIKGKDRHMPLSFICSDLKDISQYAQVSNYAYKTMKKLLPGPYTFILLATRLVPKIMLTRRLTAGIRVPDNPISLAIVRELGHPVISTSAMLPGGEVLYDPAEIDRHVGKSLDLVIDGGVLVSEPSSVIDLTGDIPKVLRKGKGDVSFFL